MADTGSHPVDGMGWGTFFGPAERAFLIAFCDRAIPESASGPGAVETGVPQFVDRHMASAYARGDLWYREGPFVEASREFGYQGPLALRDLLRAGIQETEAHCRARHALSFASLGKERQECVMRRLEKGNIALRSVDSARFFAALLGEIRIGYFADPVHGANAGMGSWKMIGYPGYPGDYRAAIGERHAPYSALPKSIAEAG